MKEVKRGNIFNSFDGLAAYMKQNGSNVYTGETALEDQVESKIENIESVETRVQNAITEAEEVLDEVSGIPSAENAEGVSVEPEETISEVANVEINDNGVVSNEDREERLKEAETVASEIEKYDGVIEEAIARDPYLDTLYKAEVIREKLSQKTKDIIRETSPELFEMINPRDVELMILLDEKFKLAKIDKKPLKEKFEIAKRKKIATAGVLAEYSKALLGQKEFMDKARELNIPLDVAKIIYKADPIFIKEIRDGENYIESVKDEISGQDIEPIPEDVIQDEPRGENEMLQKEEASVLESEFIIKKNKFKKYADGFVGYINKITDESERARLFNALSEFNRMIEEIGEGDDQDNMDRVYNTEDYMYGLSENIEKALNEKKLKIEEDEVVTEIYENISEALETGRVFSNSSYNEWYESIPAELRTTVSMVFSPEKQTGFSDVKFYTDENGTHYVAYTESNGERQARKMYVKSDNFGKSGITELISPSIIETGSKIDKMAFDDWKKTLPSELSQSVSMLFDPSKNQNYKNIEFYKDELGAHYVSYEDENGKQLRKLYVTNGGFAPSAVFDVVNPELVGLTNEGEKNNIEANESREKAESEIIFERLITEIGNCRNLALTIKTTERKDKALALLKILEESVSAVVFDKNLSDEKKISDFNEIAKNFREEFTLIYNPKTEDEQKEDEVQSVEYYDELPLKEKVPEIDIYSKYEKFGINADLLKSVEGFGELSNGKKLLVLRNYQSIILDKNSAETKEYSDYGWNRIPKIGRVGLSLLTFGGAKVYREKKMQKTLMEHKIKGDYFDFESKQQILSSLTKIAEESPKVYYDNDYNLLHTEYIDVDKFGESEESVAVIYNLNEAASRYAEIPSVWIDEANTFDSKNEKKGDYYSRLLSAKNGIISGKEKMDFSERRERYLNAREDFINLYIENIGDSPENRRHILRELNKIDEFVKMNQLFNSDPNVEAKLQDIEDTRVFNQTLSELFSNKGKYVAYGAITKMAAAATISSIAAPAGLAMVGSGYLKGKREARELLKIKRVSGSLSSEDLRENIPYNVDLKKSYEDVREMLIQTPRSDEEKRKTLEIRLREIGDKMKEGYTIERRTRKLEEFKDARFFSDRVEQLVSRCELLKESNQNEEAEKVERKIAQTAALMRELMNKNMLTFGKGEKGTEDSRTIINRLDFIHALALADATVSLDDEMIKKKAADIVGIRRDRLSDIENKRVIKDIGRGVRFSAAYASTGYALMHLAVSFFGTPNFESLTDNRYEVKAGDNIENIIRRSVSDLDHLSEHARDNIYANFLNRLNALQLKDLGITDPHHLKAGEHLDLVKLREYFENTRVNGRTLVENARLITGEKPLGAQLSQFIGNVVEHYTETPREYIKEQVEEYNANRIDKKGDNFEDKVGTKMEYAGDNSKDGYVSAKAPKEKAVDNANSQTSNEKVMKEDWSDYTIPEKIEIANKLAPELLNNQLGEDVVATFIGSSDNMPSSALLMTDYQGGGPKIDMLNKLREVLEKRGITPENGFEYKYNETLYDYVMKAYKYKIISEGISSVE